MDDGEVEIVSETTVARQIVQEGGIEAWLQSYTTEEMEPGRLRNLLEQIDGAIFEANGLLMHLT